MSKKQKKIYLLIAGGTCLLNKQGHILTIQSTGDLELWIAQMPELNILADVEPIIISNEDDELNPKIWQKIAEQISSKQMEAAGFVIVSKIDQLINTSLALSFLLQNFKKTIILTSSQISGTSFVNKRKIINELKEKQGGLALRANLINAIQIAGQPLPNPAILFGNYLVPATTAILNLSSIINPFMSINNEYWGKVDFGMNIKSGLDYSSKKSKMYFDISAKVLVIEDLPGVAWSFTKQDLSNYDGLFIKVNPYQELEEIKQKQINKWKLPTILYNYNLSTSVKGALSLSSCTENVALIKTRWAISNSKTNKEFENLMKQNIIGEFND